MQLLLNEERDKLKEYTMLAISTLWLVMWVISQYTCPCVDYNKSGVLEGTFLYEMSFTST